ncbi:MAG TPA: glycoside hydrolase family 2 TIM barrel-domain containing protein [Bacteroidota bacterium]|nr:glycoside hydrolase family 2 TIM barrel-domain containing protein [Bacteroidota bacterium]
MTEFSLTLDSSQARVTCLLNGLWEIAGGDRLQPLGEFDRTIEVPSLVDCAEPAYDWQSYDYHWYRTRFSLRGEGELRSLHLKLHQCMFGAAVWINGTFVGESISCYTSQTYKIDEYCLEGAPNEILVRAGARSTLPPESAVGRDQEKDIYVPGIWGDVELFACGEARIAALQIIPHLKRSVAEVRVTIENFSSSSRHLTVIGAIQEKASKRPASDVIPKQVALSAYGSESIVFQIPIEGVKLWSLESPFLYEARVSVAESALLHDARSASFGMREFTISGADFFLNGKKIFLRGGNIALHRFFSDRMRRHLPWNEEWVKKILIDIPRAHHFNFFRNHIGPLCHRWYDLADEHGMLIQNEWQFWRSTGTKQQITREFTEWINDSCNHPSIVMWDPLNESSDDVIRHEIVPMMKALDPTRPWESVDCFEQHPYIYSLGMVLNNRTFGFTKSLEEIEQSSTPSIVNEFLWWWLDADNRPTSLMKDVTERWLGNVYTTDELIERQSFLAGELVELFRRMQVRAIQPFVYLSNNDGPTGNWFEGDIREARVKPVLAALKNAFAPFGVSIELWDRHFTTGSRKEVRIFIFNDTPVEQCGRLHVRVHESADNSALAADAERTDDSSDALHITVPPSDTLIVTVNVDMPNLAGTYWLKAELMCESEHSSIAHSAHHNSKRGSEDVQALSAISRKVLHVFEPVRITQRRRTRRSAVLDPSGEIQTFLGLSAAAPFVIDPGTSLVITHGNAICHARYQSLVNDVSAFVRTGGALLVIEPEYRVVNSAVIRLLNDVDLEIRERADLDKGGYDSYIFAEDESHPIWKSIGRDHLKMFNGAYGGEAVSEYEVTPSVHHRVLARCGLGLQIKAIIEIPYAKGKILISRVQCRGRLVEQAGRVDTLFARRPDPVVQQLLINLIGYAFPSSES